MLPASIRQDGNSKLSTRKRRRLIQTDEMTSSMSRPTAQGWKR
jgi:hypothetical protein